jgi:hypothetical protein
MAFNYTKIANYLLGNKYGYQSFKTVNDNNRYIAEDILGDPSANSNNVNLALSDVTISKELKGSRFLLAYGNATLGEYILINDALSPIGIDDSPGHLASRNGSIVGAGIQIYTSSFTSSGTITPIVQINGSDAFSLSTLNINANNTEFKTSISQARLLDTFLANDIISFFISGSGGSYTASVMANIEVVFNT